MGKKVKAQELDELRDLANETNGDGESEPKKKTNRRGMLKMAGAALLGAAGAAAVRAVPAAAANGDYMVIGAVQNGTSSTVLQASVSGLGTFTSQNQHTSGIGLSGDGTTGLRGQGAAQGSATGPQEVGVFGVSKAGSGTGVQASATSGVGLHANATSGSAGLFVSTTGYDTQLGMLNGESGILGSGRLAMIGRGDVGAVAPNWKPAWFVHTSHGILNFQHEFVRGNDGSIWASRAQKDVVGGAPPKSRWKRVNAVRVDSADGAGAPFKPVRVVDTRLPGPLHGPWAAGSLKVVSVAGFGSGASHIPPDAVAVMGNLTAVAYTGAGFMTIMPGGIAVGTNPGDYNPASDPSSVNFIVGQGAIANAFVCGLNAGQLQVYIAVHSSHFIIDITAYLQ